MSATSADDFARNAAVAWHSGRCSPLYALAWTGAVTSEKKAVDEIEGALAYVRSGDGIFADATEAEQAEAELIRLRDYVIDAGERGPVPSWNSRGQLVVA